MKVVNKKILVPTIIGITFLIMLIIGTAYAYFSVNTRYDFSASASATTPAIGSVVLQGTNQTLSMDLTRSDMMSNNAGTYYASFNGKTKTPTEEVIGVASVDGEGTYTCDYTIKIDDNSNSIYDKFQSMTGKSEGQIVLTVNGVDYDFSISNLFPKTISGTLSGISESTPQNITAGLKFVNSSSIDQSALTDSNITLSFTTESFSCEADGGEYTIAYNLNGGTILSARPGVSYTDDTIMWDGTTDGAEYFDYFYKVSDFVLTEEELENGYTLTVYSNDEYHIFSEELFLDVTDEYIHIAPYVLIVPNDLTYDEFSLSRGIYFYYESDEENELYVSSFQINGLTGLAGVATNGKDNPTRYTIESEDITLTNPVRIGYTFIGWTGSNSNTPEITVTIPKGSVGNKEYTAVWEKNRASYAVYSADDNSLKFYNTTDIIEEGKDYRGYEATTVYSYIKLDGYEDYSDTPWYADGNNENITKIIFEDDDIPITDLKFYFWEFTNLKSVDNIPSSVQEIGWYAFGRCSSLESIIIPEGVTSIRDYAFDRCSSLASITLPSSLTSISSTAIPAPSNEYIPGADGNWYDKSTGQAYTAGTLPTGVAATYVAVRPN